MNRKSDRALYCQKCFVDRHYRQLVHCDWCGTLQCFAHSSYAGAPKGSIAPYTVGGGRVLEVRRGTCDACAEIKKLVAGRIERAKEFVAHGDAPFDVYVGEASFWENPHVLGRDAAEPEQLVALYERYLFANPEVSRSLPLLRGLKLGCSCSHATCHALLLAHYANNLP